MSKLRDRPAQTSDRPIGVFDSGLGGLTVVKALRKILPFEEIVYLGDTARLPYGTKSPETIQRFALQDTEFLIGRNVKLVIVACHSASSVALDDLKKRYRLPLLGVIAPGAEAAVRATRNNRIGVIGTNATIGSGAYERAIRFYRKDVEIVAKSTPLFVPLAEEGWLNNEVACRTAEIYLEPFRREQIDTLLLGCTHYPLLKRVIGRVLDCLTPRRVTAPRAGGKRIVLVDSSEATAAAARQTLQQMGLLRRRGAPKHRFYLSDLTPNFQETCSRFLGEPVVGVIRASLPE